MEFCVLTARLSANEAAVMDPQGQVLLEQTALALTDASSHKLPSSPQEPPDPTMGVYVGVMHMEFIQHLAGMRPLPLLLWAL